MPPRFTTRRISYLPAPSEGPAAAEVEVTDALSGSSILA
jgi:hypothetical protein